MLLFSILGATLLIQVLAAPYIDNKAQPQIVHYEFDTDHLPNYYNYNYATSDGATRSEQGAILNPGTKEEALDVNGAVRWYDDKGRLYEMSYKAGKRGYRTVIRRVRS